MSENQDHEMKGNTIIDEFCSRYWRQTQCWV